MNKPKIRFKGYEDDWEQRKLNGIADVRDGTHDSPKYVQEGHPFITSKNVSNGCINYDDVQYVTDEDYEEINKRSKVDIHDILMGMIGTIGNLALIREEPDFAIKNVALIKYTGDVDYQFLYQALQTGYVTNQLSAGMDGGTQKFMSLKKIRELDIPYPEVQEQEQIGIYFKNLDHLITLRQRKCEETKTLKKYMLQKMFPQNGTNVPEIRFDGFTDTWKQRKLGEMMEITSVKRIHQSDWTNSGVRFLRARDIVAESKKEEVTELLFISQEKYDEYSALSGKVKIGDLLVTGVGTIGVPMLINSEEPLYFKDGNIIWFRNENAIDGRFLYHSFNGNNIQTFIKESAGTGTVGTYTIESGKKTPINLPHQKEEQIKIGKYFNSLDHLITLHQQKCDELQNIKKFMLQNMFV